MRSLFFCPVSVSYLKWYPGLCLAILRLQIIFLSWTIKCCPKGHLLRTEIGRHLEVLREGESAQGHARGEVNAHHRPLWVELFFGLPRLGHCLSPGPLRTRPTGRGQRGAVWRDPHHLSLCRLALAPSATVLRVFSLLPLPTTSV